MTNILIDAQTKISMGLRRKSKLSLSEIVKKMKI